MVPPSVYKPIKDNIFLLREKNYQTWERFFFKQKIQEQQHGELTETRDVIIQSWNRCKQYEDLHPLIPGSVKNISNEQLKEARVKNNFYHLAQPVLKKATEELSFTRHAILFCDADGTILDCYGDCSLLRKLGNISNVNNGAQWSERWAGTNAIGTSILLQQPVQIFSSEHFAHGCHDWVCSSAPIMNPLTNELIGVINLSTTAPNFNPLSMMKTIEIANQIERIFFRSNYQAYELMQSVYIEAISKWKHQTVILCNRNGSILKASSELPVDQLDSIIGRIIENNHQSEKTEWEEEVILQGSLFQVKFKKICWHYQFLGLIAIMEKKIKSSQPIGKQNFHAKYSFQNLIGKSEAFKSVLHTAKIAASGDSNVLITGDSGTGKELIANAIHQASSRSDYPFIALNCAAIPKDLLPSELFGYVAGAFTGANPKGSIGKFELANKGTLFLDEIGDMPLEAQVQLLRVIQEQEIIRIGDKTRIPIDVRIIAATNKNFSEEIQLGKFRKDLYYRLNVIPIELPSLQQRAEDIPLLAEYFVRKLTLKNRKGPYQITVEAMEYLENYSWPGNIRELENVIEYAVTFSENGVITPMNLPRDIKPQQKQLKEPTQMNPVNQAELDWILSALKQSNMNVSEAAKELNMSRSTVYRKLNRMGYDIKFLK
ncbi:sigma-54-dependent Fis family transcriptional regulator [Neobacillus citreus]|nr:sigma-54-dependent Fis family transcriptional regulator [Neobacillus citreus]MCH6267534.1 sigma-54-dependent Fis family transcriptional regulator [Neobacillus citreus]